MAYTGFLKFLSDSTSLNVGDVGFYFSFNNPGQPSSFTSDFNSQVSANLIGGAGFWSQSGSGFFNGNTRMSVVRNSSAFAGEASGEASFLISSEKSGTTDGIIFSSLGSGQGSVSQITHSGFCFGFNKSNKFFFESFDNFNQKPIKIFINDVFSSKNCFSVSVSRSSFNLKRFDFSSNSVIDNFYSFQRPIHLSNSFSFGSGLTNSPHWSISDGWRGFIDDVCYSDKFNFAHEAFVPFSSGMITNYFQSGENFTLIDSFVVTGYSTGQVPLYSGITGYETNITGVIEDDFGNIYSGIETIPLYGITYGSGVVELTGLVQIPVFSEPEEFFFPDLREMKSYGFSRANSLQQVDSGDHYFCLYVDDISGNFNLNLDKEVFFDGAASRVRYNKPVLLESFSLYSNGVFQTSGAYSYNEFDGLSVLSGDYAHSGRFFYFKQFNPDSSDRFIVEEYPYRIHSSFYENFSHNGNADFLFYSGSGDLSDFSAFFNGQKLASGTHFRMNNSGAFLKAGEPLFSGDFGTLSVVSGLSGMAYSSGYSHPVLSFSKKTIGKRHLSFYLNGIRLFPDSYVLCSESDFLTGITARRNNLSPFIDNSVVFFR